MMEHDLDLQPANLDLAREFATVALAIAGQPDLDSTRLRIVELAVEHLGCQSAALWRRTRDGLQLVTSSDPELIDVMSRIGEHAGSLAKECLAEGKNLQVPDFTVETRWPNFVHHVLAETPIRSAAGFLLGLDGAEPIGVLTLYSIKPHALTMDQLALASIFAAHASIALEDADHAHQAVNLRQALDSNRRIGMAIGILIALYHLSEQQAFDLMRVASQNNHVKLHQIAEEVILTGAAPTWPQPGS